MEYVPSLANSLTKAAYRSTKTKNPQEVKNKSVDTRFFFRFANILSLLVPIFSSSFFVVFKERERTRGCLSKRVKNISRRSNTASRAFIHLKLPRVRTAVFGRLFFFPVDRDLIIRLAAEGGCGKIVADDGGTVFDPVPFTALEPSARPTSPRRVESSVRTGGRSRICGLASTFFSRCHKQKIGPKKICQHPMYE